LKKENEIIKRIILVVIGSLISAIGFNAFIIPHRLLSGGISGIALLIQYVTSYPAGIFIFILNIPVFIYGLKSIDRDFILFSFLGMLSFSVFQVLTVNISSFLKVDDILLSTIYGGVLNGIGMGIVFKNRASQGGTDIIAVAAKRKSGINISTVSFVINSVIVLIGATLSNVETALYTLILMYIGYYVMDRVIDGFDRKKLLFIVTEKEKEVSYSIMQHLGRGVTYFYGEGAYTGENKKVIYCIVTSKELSKIKKLIEDIDDTAFISIMDASEVQGRGFKKPAF
jgi:uncharacterized membrane-anchored protein YitT (DUF2179 family)